MMKNTNTAAMPTVVNDAKIIEAIAYNITAMAQIHSLPLPSLDLLLMKDTKTVAVSIVVIDAKTIEAIAYNIAVMAQIQPSMLEPADVSLLLPSLDLLLMKDTKTMVVSTVVIDAKMIEAIAYTSLRRRRSSPP
jgi:hypothetical protein